MVLDLLLFCGKFFLQINTDVSFPPLTLSVSVTLTLSLVSYPLVPPQPPPLPSGCSFDNHTTSRKCFGWKGRRGFVNLGLCPVRKGSEETPIYTGRTQWKRTYYPHFNDTGTGSGQQTTWEEGEERRTIRSCSRRNLWARGSWVLTLRPFLRETVTQ